MGLDPEAMGGRRTIAEPVPVWPDMLDGFLLFCAARTQWRWAGAGFGSFQTGMIYEALPQLAETVGVQLTDRGTLPPRVFSDVRALEAEALAVWARRRK